MKRIRILSCGGTIDKIDFDSDSRYEVGPPNIPDIQNVRKRTRQ